MVDFMGASPYFKDYASKKERRFMIGIVYLYNQTAGYADENLANAVAKYFDISRQTVFRCASAIPEEYKKIFGVYTPAVEAKQKIAKKRYASRAVDLGRQAKVKAILYKGGVCQKCGIAYNGENAAIFDFHHVDPSMKELNIGGALRSSHFENIVPELDKTIMVCSNCHRLIHHSRSSND